MRNYYPLLSFVHGESYIVS